MAQSSPSYGPGYRDAGLVWKKGLGWVEPGRPSRHGESRSGATSPEHQTWTNMRRRCADRSKPEYKNYGGRGIKVCARWRNSYEAFLSDMGRRPSSLHSIERIDNDGNYEPKNCKWALRYDQARNRRDNIPITFMGVTKCRADWADDLGISRTTLRGRLDRHGWSVERALTTPVPARRGGI